MQAHACEGADLPAQLAATVNSLLNLQLLIRGARRRQRSRMRRRRSSNKPARPIASTTALRGSGT